MRSITFDLPDDLAAQAEAAIQSGAYPSMSALITAAIHSWQQSARDSLRADIAVAEADLAAGRLVPFDVDEIATLSRRPAQ